MSQQFESERKASKKAVKAAGELAAALRHVDAADVQEQPFKALSAVAAARAACVVLRPLAANLDIVEHKLTTLAGEAMAAAEREKGRLVSELDDALRAGGLKLEGHLPKLRCGPFTLELVTGEQPEVRVSYGPGIALLATVAPDPEAVATEVKARLKELEGEPLDDDAFLRELRLGWRVALARVGGGEGGDKAPIVAVLAEVAAGRQSRAWRLNPTRQGFQTYSRVQFAHDVARLRRRTLGAEELVLTVATRDQTRSESDHLWIEGTHYAYLSFRMS